MLTDYCCLTTNPCMHPPSKKRKSQQKLKDCQFIFIIIKVLEYSNIGVH